MEGRRIFAGAQRRRELEGCAFTRQDRGEIKDRYNHVLEMFPVLGERRKGVAGYLSGGEQQMLAIRSARAHGGTALVAPRRAVARSPPLIQEQIRDTVAKIAAGGTSVLLVEQNAMMALSIAHHAYVIENGESCARVLARSSSVTRRIREAYLGMASADTARSRT